VTEDQVHINPISCEYAGQLSNAEIMAC
jgi:hypothetical protein